VAALVASVTNASAHRLDELLQAARIGIDDGRLHLELDLTPGVALSEAIVADIDRNQDRSFSRDEQDAFVGNVLGALLVMADGRALHLSTDSLSFPAVEVLQRGEGFIRIRAEAALLPATAGQHAIFVRNSFRKDVSVYLANALIPQSDRIAVNAQKRDGPQSELTIEYTVAPARIGATSLWMTAMTIVAMILVLKSAAKTYPHLP